MTTDPKALADDIERLVQGEVQRCVLNLTQEEWSTILAALRAASSAEAMRESADLIWLRDQVVALCEDTEENAENIYLGSKSGTPEQKQAAKDFVRGVVHEAKGIRRTISEIVSVRLNDRAAPSDPGSAPVGGWRPIETVPERVEVVVRGGHTMFGDPCVGSRIAVVDDRADLYREDDGTLRRTSPTMWHPAPPPPAEPSRDAQEGERS